MLISNGELFRQLRQLNVNVRFKHASRYFGVYKDKFYPLFSLRQKERPEKQILFSMSWLNECLNGLVKELTSKQWQKLRIKKQPNADEAEKMHSKKQMISNIFKRYQEANKSKD